MVLVEVWPQPPHRELWVNDTTRLPDLEARGPAFCPRISKALVMGRPLGEDKGGPVTSQAFLGSIAPAGGQFFGEGYGYELSEIMAAVAGG